jgi:hypothetical protein
MRVPCHCLTVMHERPGCPAGWIQAQCALLFMGLYDDRRPRAASPRRVRLLNPDYDSGDPIAQRFALLEID